MLNPREPGAPPRIIYHKSWQGWSEGIRWVNNIFHNECPNAVYEFGESRKNVFEHNLFFGLRPAREPKDAHKITGDPLLVKAGGAGAGRDAAAGAYSLRRGSAAIGAGIVLPEHPAHDFARRPIVVRQGRVDVGAVQYAPRGD
jgi:hypothetical protein